MSNPRTRPLVPVVNTDAVLHRRQLADRVNAAVVNEDIETGVLHFGNMPEVNGNPIVERGSNSDGDFVRFADGTQICQVAELGSLAVTTADGELFRSASQSWTYPAAFISTPPSIAMNPSGTASRAHGALNAVSSTAATAFVVSATSVTATIRRNWLAIGRWF
jgi:hypothetical protein